jgi:hypothetical protein
MMKKVALVIGGIALICILAVAFAIFWFWSKTRDIAEYLPASPTVSGVAITGADAKVFNHFAIRHFRFTTREGGDCAAVAKLFEVQLNAAGWEKVNDCSTARVSSGVWRHREKLGGNLHLVFTVVILNENAHEYAGSMVTQPYWPHNR